MCIGFHHSRERLLKILARRGYTVRYVQHLACLEMFFLENDAVVLWDREGRRLTVSGAFRTALRVERYLDLMSGARRFGSLRAMGIWILFRKTKPDALPPVALPDAAPVTG
jgi:hypothetical protein